MSAERVNSRPLALTPGEPAGVGPDLIIQLAQNGIQQPLVVVACAKLLQSRATELGLPLELLPWQGGPVPDLQKSQLLVQDVPLEFGVRAGELDPQNAPYVLNCLDKAIEGALDETFAGVVTGPVHKGVINQAGIAFSGHTEYLQHKCGVERVVMMLASPAMKVALATTHLPLKDVASELTRERLTQVLDILVTDLRRYFGCERPRVLVAGLNPHAGESGHMGREEIDVIEPVLEALRTTLDAELLGPLPADTLFTPKYLESADAVLAMYHDQGLPVLKYQSFGEAVNITLGLPIIRTSVDHGTALDLAGTGQADPGSLKCALEQGIQMSNARAAVRANT